MWQKLKCNEIWKNRAMFCIEKDRMFLRNWDVYLPNYTLLPPERQLSWGSNEEMRM
jgi:hypothetical protein